LKITQNITQKIEDLAKWNPLKTMVDSSVSKVQWKPW